MAYNTVVSGHIAIWNNKHQSKLFTEQKIFQTWKINIKYCVVWCGVVRGVYHNVGGYQDDRTLREQHTLLSEGPPGGGIRPDLTTLQCIHSTALESALQQFTKYYYQVLYFQWDLYRIIMAFNSAQKILLLTRTNCLKKLLMISNLKSQAFIRVSTHNIHWDSASNCFILQKFPNKICGGEGKFQAKAKPYFIFNKCSTKFDNQVCCNISVLNRKIFNMLSL